MQDLPTTDYDAIVIIGGDGTLNAAISGYMHNSSRTCPIAVLPGGTGNDFARTLGVLDYPQGITAMFSGRSQETDIGMFETAARRRAFLT
jgi:diacylglycerol kinase family enzyme